MAAIGSVWGTGTWSDDIWADGTWGEAQAAVVSSSSGGYLRASDRRRTKREIDEARRRFGINIPEDVAEVIEAAAEDQVADLVTDPQKQKRDLQIRLRVRDLQFQARYLELLAAERERLIHEELAKIADMTRRNNEGVTRLMLLALLDS